MKTVPGFILVTKGIYKYLINVEFIQMVIDNHVQQPTNGVIDLTIRAASENTVIFTTGSQEGLIIDEKLDEVMQLINSAKFPWVNVEGANSNVIN